MKERTGRKGEIMEEVKKQEKVREKSYGAMNRLEEGREAAIGFETHR